MLFALAFADYAVIAAYLVLMLFIGAWASRKQGSDDEYFLASRSLPWFAVGCSILATLMSSLTYLSEPGEVWQSGITNFLGKAAAILIEMLLVWFLFIPFLMRFRFTSAYEYLDYRFGRTARWLGVVLFMLLTISWMGFVVLTMSRAIAHVADLPLWVVILTVGSVTTIYTVLGGLRAVVWTDVAQVVLMIGGCLITLIFVAVSTGSFLPDWLRSTNAYLESKPGGGVTLFSLDPYQRTTIITAAISMLVWNMVTHVGNQMMVQRYFSCTDLKAARRSFAVATALHILVNGLLMIAGLAVLHYYVTGAGTLAPELQTRGKADQIFPTFMVQVLPPGLTGAVLAAVLAAAMSTIDSGINSLATVLAVERRRMQGNAAGSARSQVRYAQVVTLIAGAFITAAAYGLDRLTAGRNILEMMPRTFNCFVVPMGGMFLLGMFLPFCRGAGAVAAAIAGLITSVCVSYAREFFGLERDLSFTWVLPSSLLMMIAVAVTVRLLFGPAPAHRQRGLTWSSRDERPAIPEEAVAPRP